LQDINYRGRVKMKILVVAPHNDDEILGVGGTIKRYINQGHEVYVCEVTSGPMYQTLQSEARKAHKFLGIKESIFLNLPVGQLKISNPYEINARIDEAVKRVKPSVAFVPFLGDMHHDHREVLESCMVSFRPIYDYTVKKIYMYETLSETGWNIPIEGRSFIPNVWMNITNTIEDKIEAMKFYKSQMKEYPHPRSEEAIRALAMYRGSTVGVEYAESFMLVREIDSSFGEVKHGLVQN